MKLYLDSHYRFFDYSRGDSFINRFMPRKRQDTLEIGFKGKFLMDC